VLSRVVATEFDQRVAERRRDLDSTDVAVEMLHLLAQLQPRHDVAAPEDRDPWRLPPWITADVDDATTPAAPADRRRVR
jgi:hypothetical protein